jgi:hypothetical protein
MQRLGFKSSSGDPDFWLRQSTQVTGEDYYEYFLLYAEIVTVILENQSKDPR